MTASTEDDRLIQRRLSHLEQHSTHQLREQWLLCTQPMANGHEENSFTSQFHTSNAEPVFGVPSENSSERNAMVGGTNAELPLTYIKRQTKIQIAGQVLTEG